MCQAPLAQRLLTPLPRLQPAPYILWCFLLTPQVCHATMRANTPSARELGIARRSATKRTGRLGETTCSICLVLRCNASIHTAKHAATGCARTPRVPSVRKDAALV